MQSEPRMNKLMLILMVSRIGASLIITNKHLVLYQCSLFSFEFWKCFLCTQSGVFPPFLNWRLFLVLNIIVTIFMSILKTVKCSELFLSLLTLSKCCHQDIYWNLYSSSLSSVIMPPLISSRCRNFPRKFVEEM